MVEYPPAPSPGVTPQERLLFLQYQKNVSHEELARIGNTNTASISGVENGRFHTLRPATLRAISDHYSLPYSFLGAYDQLPDDTIAEKLLKGRLYRLVDQGKAAVHFGVDRRTYFKWEHGQIATGPRAKRILPDKLASWISVFDK